MSDFEHAAGARVPSRRRTFPVDWGDPPADATTEQIAGWIKGQISYGRALRASGVAVSWLARTDGREAGAQLERLEAPRMIAARQRLLQLHAKARPPWMVDDA
jgi:hypothetical protein